MTITPTRHDLRPLACLLAAGGFLVAGGAYVLTGSAENTVANETFRQRKEADRLKNIAELAADYSSNACIRWPQRAGALRAGLMNPYHQRGVKSTRCLIQGLDALNGAPVTANSRIIFGRVNTDTGQVIQTSTIRQIRDAGHLKQIPVK